MANPVLLEMRNISKSFPGVKALDHANLIVKRGTVHALVGENGAGKSTLMKVLIGVHQKDSGEIVFDGEPLEAENIRVALEKKISMIFQEISALPNLTVAENIYIGREPRKKNSVLIDKKKQILDTKALLDSLEITDIDPECKMSDLSIAKMQMVEIAKAISYNSKLIIMDEPTSSLTEDECEHLFKIVNELKRQNVSFVFISHKMDEIYTIADEITVMRDGQYICTKPREELPTEQLIALMVGRKIEDIYPKHKHEIGEKTLEVIGLTAKGAFEDISFYVRKGEIVGFAGLVGSGRTEVMEALFGYRLYQKGTISINGRSVSIQSPSDAIANRIAMLTEDRKATGLYQPLSVEDNMVMPSLDRYVHGLPLLKRKEIQRDVAKEIERYSIKTPSAGFVVNNLSGGNQQKVLLARWTLIDPNILILDEPTRGIDVGAKVEIYRYMEEFAASGKSIIMISSELPEIIGMSDRVYVMCEGHISGELSKSDLDQAHIMEYAAGVKK